MGKFVCSTALSFAAVGVLVLSQLRMSLEKTLFLPFDYSDMGNDNSDYFDFNRRTAAEQDYTTNETKDYFFNARFYHCGYDSRLKLGKIFPEQVEKLNKSTLLTMENVNETSEDDVLVFGMGGPCLEWRTHPKEDKKRNRYIPWLEKHFNGTVIYFNGEVYGGELWQGGGGNSSKPPKRHFHFGYVEDGCQSTRMHYLSQVFMNERKFVLPYFLQAQNKPRSTRERFLLYVNSNCVDYRENAFDTIALANNASIVEWGGKCSGNMKNITNKRHRIAQRKYWVGNFRLMRKYKFCLVMENTKADGYITEKILFAFAGGCIPIYYGTEEVFDVFNPRAFIYYNISDPEPALDKIKFLAGNKSAYNSIMAEPILLDGNNTIEKYFYVDDEITPNGMRNFRDKALKMLQGGGC